MSKPQWTKHMYEFLATAEPGTDMLPMNGWEAWMAMCMWKKMLPGFKPNASALPIQRGNNYSNVAPKGNVLGVALPLRKQPRALWDALS